MASGGAQYTQARTPIPSDSFPGIVGQVTGGDPSATGVYYDDSFNHKLFPAGTTNCATATLGAEVNYSEALDKNPLALDAGQGLPGLPGSILSMTGNPTTLLDPAKMPVDPRTCTPVYPHQYLKVNTIFEVARHHGLRTAWSDKHPAYEILNGPTGRGIQDLFTPEINSNAISYAAGQDWTKDNQATMQYDSYKVQAVLNEIDGYDHSRTTRVGVPAIFGMNFQTVSTAEKLPSSNGLKGGYVPGTTTPGPLLSRALGYINTKLGCVAERAPGTRPGQLDRDHPVRQAWTVTAGSESAHPDPRRPDHRRAERRLGGSTPHRTAGARWDQRRCHPAVADRSLTDGGEVRRGLLMSTPATGNTIDGSPRTLASSGLHKVFAGAAAARYFHVSVADPRHPDVWGIVQQGVVYTGGKGKIAEHGGPNPEDRSVPLVVYAPGVSASAHGSPVKTTQIAPTILRLLGLDPRELQAVQIEGTQVLPGLR